MTTKANKDIFRVEGQTTKSDVIESIALLSAVAIVKSVAACGTENDGSLGLNDIRTVLSAQNYSITIGSMLASKRTCNLKSLLDRLQIIFHSAVNLKETRSLLRAALQGSLFVETHGT